MAGGSLYDLLVHKKSPQFDAEGTVRLGLLQSYLLKLWMPLLLLLLRLLLLLLCLWGAVQILSPPPRTSSHATRHTSRQVRHSSRRLVQLAAEAASGVAHLHAHGIIHRDLACRNLLVDEASAGVAVADFGFARLRAKVGGQAAAARTHHSKSNDRQPTRERTRAASNLALFLGLRCGNIYIYIY
jgi:serine/threonine protein kinase